MTETLCLVVSHNSQINTCIDTCTRSVNYHHNLLTLIAFLNMIKYCTIPCIVHTESHIREERGEVL